ncbi:MAG: Mpo1 family 2-hydroxy fatty acid dioxygenase [Burkholderiaceae bacterium]
MNQTTQRQIDLLLSKYSESHRNPKNEIIHCICVPAIVFSLLGLIWMLGPLVALAVTVLSLAYYATLSVPFMFGMLLMSGAMLGVLSMLPPNWVLPLSIGVFVIAWIGQFIGHHIEGKKPSFFDDLRFLLIGPLFVLGFLYRRLRITY